ncbi:MAG: hypothetical protein LUG58_03280 [Clostridiales bacterium]|nr:hypothetical protein [Clostridiales bacterium]
MAEETYRLTNGTKKLSDVSNALTKLTQATRAATASVTSLKKAVRDVLNFDEINKLSKAASSSSGSKKSSGSSRRSGGSGSGGKSRLTALQQAAKWLEKLKKLASGLLTPLKKLWAMKGWKVVTAFQDLKAAAEKLAKQLSGGLKWGWENILKPLAVWTLDEAAPAVLEALAGAFSLVSAALDVLAPIGQAIWDNFLSPLAAWAGEGVVAVLEGLGAGLSFLAEQLEGVAGGVKDLLQADLAVSVGVTLSNTASGVWNTFKTAWGKLSGVAVSIAAGLASTASGLWSKFKSAWSGLSSVAVSIGNSLKHTAGSLWSAFKEKWGTRAVSIGNSLKTSAASLWSAFKEKWGTRTVSITNSLKNTAADLWSKFKSGWKNKTLGLTITYNTNVGAVKKAVYKALGLSGWPTIQFAAKGGIVDRATLFGNTVAGEAGQEAIVPLERNTQWADIVATQIANKLAASGGGNQTVTINTYVTLDGKVVGKASADYAINQARATGQLPWAAYT